MVYPLRLVNIENSEWIQIMIDLYCYSCMANVHLHSDFIFCRTRIILFNFWISFAIFCSFCLFGVICHKKNSLRKKIVFLFVVSFRLELQFIKWKILFIFFFCRVFNTKKKRTNTNKPVIYCLAFEIRTRQWDLNIIFFSQSFCSRFYKLMCANILFCSIYKRN